MIMVLCNIPLIFKNVCFHFLEDCVRFVFLNFVTCFSPFKSTSSWIIVSLEQSNSLLQFGIYFAQWDCYFFKLLEEILICFEEELCVLTSRLLFGFALYLWLFSEQFSLYVSSRGHLFITSTKKIEGEGAGGTKFWLILLMVVLGFFGEGDFLSVMWLSCVPLLPRG